MVKTFVLGAFLVSVLSCSQEEQFSSNAQQAVTEQKEFGPLLSLVENQPSDIKLGNELRRLCREQKNPDACIGAFDRLLDSHPNEKAVRYNAALAYVDKIASQSHSFWKQGRLSTQAIKYITVAIEKDQDDWLALFIRGSNHLYWPNFYRHLGKAIADLERCLELSSGLPENEIEPYHALAYMALGDAFVKDGELGKARNTWQSGKKLYPLKEIIERLGILEENLEGYVANARDLDKPIDTDLAFLWGEKDL